jgi:hypothetical protein
VLEKYSVSKLASFISIKSNVSGVLSTIKTLHVSIVHVRLSPVNKSQVNISHVKTSPVNVSGKIYSMVSCKDKIVVQLNSAYTVFIHVPLSLNIRFAVSA